MVSCCWLFCSVPSGVLLLAAATAACSSSRRCRARRAPSGRSGCAPRISGCRRSTPARRRRCVDSDGEITFSAKASRSVSGTDVAGQRHQQDRRVGRIDLAVARRAGHLRRQRALRARDRRLHVGRGGVDVAVEHELDGDRGLAERIGGRDRIDAGDRGELLDQRRRDRGRHGLGRGAGQLRRDVDDRELGAGQCGDRQELVGEQPAQHERERHQQRGDGPADAEFGDRHRGLRPARSARVPCPCFGGARPGSATTADAGLQPLLAFGDDRCLRVRGRRRPPTCRRHSAQS